MGISLISGKVTDEKVAFENKNLSKMLLGEFTQDDLEKAPHSRWFVPGYENYEPKKEALKTIEKNIHDYEILMFMGTWCADSRYEVPKFFKLLDEVKFDRKNLKNIAVNRAKKAPGSLDQEFIVHRIPTIIFIKDGKEANRFVEYSMESLEEDIAKIVEGKEYIDPYSE